MEIQSWIFPLGLLLAWYSKSIVEQFQLLHVVRLEEGAEYRKVILRLRVVNNMGLNISLTLQIITD